ncbi:MAG: GPW/gp25 family protein [Microthrixaceae bacterium]|jgi:phage baseplate assembly protein W|nr:GPW/gp25 family protein [Microthrixaceae bacterium]
MAARLALPLRIGARGLAVVTQDSPAEIAQSVGLLVATRPGERRSVPEYGVPEPLFVGMNPAAIADAVDEWEPRADPLLVDQIADGVVDVATLTPNGATS